MNMKKRPVVLFLCTHNSCRSQMAEGFLRHLAGDSVEVLSAGLSPTEVHPLAIRAMADAGIDISDQRSKDVKGILGEKPITHAVFVCASAEENCPSIYPFALQRHSWPFEDPAEFEGTDEERYQKFIEVRDQIARKVQNWLSDIEVVEASGMERDEL